jgi:hypothetical protein
MARDFDPQKQNSMLAYKDINFLAKQSQATGFHPLQSNVNSKYLSPRERILARMQQKQYLEGESISRNDSSKEKEPISTVKGLRS